MYQSVKCNGSSLETEYLDSVNIVLLLIVAILLIRIINEQYFTTRWSSRVLSIICRLNPGAYYSHLLS